MKKEIFKEIKIPKEVEVSLDGTTLTVKGEKGELKRKFKTDKIIFEIKDDKIIMGNKKATKKEKKMINTNISHIKNMIKGVREGFEYKLKAVFSHFPMTIEIKDDIAVIKNFIGEKVPRKVKLPKGVNVKINGQDITITSPDKEAAGQAAANLETITKIRLRDRRVFQDGIFMTNKAGKEI